MSLRTMLLDVAADVDDLAAVYTVVDDVAGFADKLCLEWAYM